MFKKRKIIKKPSIVSNSKEVTEGPFTSSTTDISNTIHNKRTKIKLSFATDDDGNVNKQNSDFDEIANTTKNNNPPKNSITSFLKGEKHSDSLYSTNNLHLSKKKLKSRLRKNTISNPDFGSNSNNNVFSTSNHNNTKNNKDKDYDLEDLKTLYQTSTDLTKELRHDNDVEAFKASTSPTVILNLEDLEDEDNNMVHNKINNRNRNEVILTEQQVDIIKLRKLKRQQQESNRDYGDRDKSRKILMKEDREYVKLFEQNNREELSEMDKGGDFGTISLPTHNDKRNNKKEGYDNDEYDSVFIENSDGRLALTENEQLQQDLEREREIKSKLHDIYGELVMSNSDEENDGNEFMALKGDIVLEQSELTANIDGMIEQVQKDLKSVDEKLVNNKLQLDLLRKEFKTILETGILPKESKGVN
ncbi:uncharacterized protein SCDLUD_003678 [Saccharomycodes ludwigii]|uniref:uncharacterized protein n=1 Tax=Saccharomycodes ludwigii TaxID=36035 RepID=UPI001E8A1A6D|nr:hypothetical protein SCDLUD_003678 [Saccharomycodes ludwigii]KAH3900679.1 hypothetical protein SCDLUD_003678 [Saccharomycodes ludwigii]